MPHRRANPSRNAAGVSSSTSRHPTWSLSRWHLSCPRSAARAVRSAAQRCRLPRRGREWADWRPCGWGTGSSRRADTSWEGQQDEQRPPPCRCRPGVAGVVEVAERAFAYVQPDGSWCINNTGFLVADDGVTAVDTCSTERRTRAFLDAVRDASEAPLRLLVDTHHHGDHTHGNYLTHPAAIVAHERCREAILETGIVHVPGVWDDVDRGELEVAPPIVTFEDKLTVFSGDIRVELHYIGTRAHTTNDIVAWLPEQRCCTPATWCSRSPPSSAARSATPRPRRLPTRSPASRPSATGAPTTCSTRRWRECPARRKARTVRRRWVRCWSRPTSSSPLPAAPRTTSR